MFVILQAAILGFLFLPTPVQELKVSTAQPTVHIQIAEPQPLPTLHVVPNYGMQP